MRDLAAEPVEADVEVLERRQVEHHGGERPLEPVVAHVELVEELEALERLREAAMEAIGVEVEEREVGEEAEVLGERAGDPAVVKVDAGDGELVPVFGGRRAEHAGVVAHMRAAPVESQVLGVGGDGVLPCLQGDVGLLQPRVDGQIVFW